jgi:hypothetical protein
LWEDLLHPKGGAGGASEPGTSGVEEVFGGIEAISAGDAVSSCVVIPVHERMRYEQELRAIILEPQAEVVVLVLSQGWVEAGALCQCGGQEQGAGLYMPVI